MQTPHEHFVDEQKSENQSILVVVIIYLMKVVFWIINRWALIAFLIFLLVPIALIYMTLVQHDNYGLMWFAVQVLLWPLSFVGIDMVSSSADLLILFSFWTAVFGFIGRLFDVVIPGKLTLPKQRSVINKLYLSLYGALIIALVFVPGFSSQGVSDLPFVLGAFLTGYIFFGFYIITQKAATDWYKN